MASPLGKGQDMASFLSERMKAVNPEIQAKTQKPAEGAVATQPAPVPAPPPKLTDISPNRAERRPSDAQRLTLKPEVAIDRLYTAFDKLNTLTEQAKAPDSRLQILGKALNQAWENIKANPKKFIFGCLIVGLFITLSVITGGTGAVAILAAKPAAIIALAKAAFGFAAGIAAIITAKLTIFKKSNKAAPEPFDPKKTQDLTQLAGALNTLRQNLGKAKLEYSDAAEYVNWMDNLKGLDVGGANSLITGKKADPQTYREYKAKLNKADLPKEHALLENTALALNELVGYRAHKFEGDPKNINDIIANGEKLQKALDNFVKEKISEVSRGLEDATHAQQQELLAQLGKMNELLPAEQQVKIRIPPAKQEAAPAASKKAEVAEEAELPPAPDGYNDVDEVPPPPPDDDEVPSPPPLPRFDEDGYEIPPAPEEEEQLGAQPAAAAPAAAAPAAAAPKAAAPKAAASAAPKPVEIEDCITFDKLSDIEQMKLKNEYVFVKKDRTNRSLTRVKVNEVINMFGIGRNTVNVQFPDGVAVNYDFNEVYVPKEK